jgi:hypothetical protein
MGQVYDVEGLCAAMDMDYEDALLFFPRWVSRVALAAMDGLRDHDITDRLNETPVVDTEVVDQLVMLSSRLFVLLDTLRQVLHHHDMLYLSADFNVRLPGGHMLSTPGVLKASHQPGIASVRIDGATAKMQWKVPFIVDSAADTIGPIRPDGPNPAGMQQLVMEPTGAEFTPLEELYSPVYDIRLVREARRSTNPATPNHIYADFELGFETLLLVFTETLAGVGVRNPLELLFNRPRDHSPSIHQTLPSFFRFLQRYYRLFQGEGAGNVKRRSIIALTFAALIEFQAYYSGLDFVELEMTQAYRRWFRAIFCVGRPAVQAHNTLGNYALLKTRLLQSMVENEYNDNCGDAQTTHRAYARLVSEAFMMTFDDVYELIFGRFLQLKLPGMDVHLVASMAASASRTARQAIPPALIPHYEFFVAVCSIDRPDVVFPDLPGRALDGLLYSRNAREILATDPPDFSSPTGYETDCTTQLEWIHTATVRTRRIWERLHVPLIEFDSDEEPVGVNGSDEEEDDDDDDEFFGQMPRVNDVQGQWRRIRG